jgi:hypothetical protein
MNTCIRITVLLMVSALCLGAGPEPAWAAKPGGGGGDRYKYTLVRLAYPNAVRTHASRLNDLANVAGTYYDADNSPSGFYYDRASGAYTSLGSGTSAWGINQQNAIVGRDELLGRGLYWATPTAVPLELPSLGDDGSSDAQEVNDAGIITGKISDASGNSIPAVWQVRDDGLVGPVRLPLPAGYATGYATHLSEEAAGVTLVVGRLSDYGQEQEWQPVFWAVTSDEDGLTVSGPTLFEGNYLGGTAWGVNNFGEAVGSIFLPTEPTNIPVLWPAGQSWKGLPLFSNAVWGAAVSINDAGEIVGSQLFSFRGRQIQIRAVLWTNATTVVELSNEVQLNVGGEYAEYLDGAFDINNKMPRGDILAHSIQTGPCLLIAK